MRDFREDCERHICMCPDGIQYQSVLKLNYPTTDWKRFLSVVEDHIMGIDTKDYYEERIDWPAVWDEWEKHNV